MSKHPTMGILPADFNPLEHGTPLEDLLALQDIVERIERTTQRVGHPHILEVGSWVGGSALAMVAAGAKVYCVEHLKGNEDDRIGDVAARYGPEGVLKAMLANLGAAAFHYVFPCIGTSEMWAHAWPTERKLDGVYLDGDHRYEEVLRDIRLWVPKLRPGGILFGHDYECFEGVTRAVDEYALEVGRPVERLGRCVWLLEV